ncbi:MAG: META domain-containing protein [Chitinophagales bacterium]|nr:META domain-containing protein [Chitinophagales bacterium]
MHLRAKSLTLMLLFICARFAPVFAQKNIAMNALYGIYKGTLPCADCPGINYRLSLQHDSTFEESAFYPGRSDTAAISTGTYSVTDLAILQLQGSKFTTGIFQIQPAALQMLDVNGTAINGDLSAHYLLRKVTRSIKNTAADETGIRTVSVNRKKFSQGISFYAAGNEPSWTLDIKQDDEIYFTTSEGLTMDVPFVKAMKTAGTDVASYHSQTTSGVLKIHIQPAGCMDNMSGERYTFSVIIDVKCSGDQEYRHFEGCGNAVPDFDLEGKWYLKNAAAIMPGAKDLQQQLPYVEINPDSLAYAGFAGCNRMAGKITLPDKGAISFEKGAITMMACPYMEQESAFIDALTSCTRYSMNGDEMMLYNAGKDTLSMSKRIPSANLNLRLIDIWVLETMNGKKAEPKSYGVELPRLEINSQFNFTGTTGCNDLSGTITADDHAITLTMQHITKNACSNALIEAAFTEALKSSNTWTIANNRLTLSKNGKALLVFRKAD